MEDELRVVIPLSMFTELVTKAGQVSALERMIRSTKYSIDQKELINLFGLEISNEDKEYE